MKWLMKKTIFVTLLIVVFFGNVFATNVQTFDTAAERCDLESLHTNPCAVVSFGDTVVEIEQETDVSSPIVDMALDDPLFVSLIQKDILPRLENNHLHHPYDLAPPSRKQLARSHL